MIYIQAIEMMAMMMAEIIGIAMSVEADPFPPVKSRGGQLCDTQPLGRRSVIGATTLP